MAMRDRFGGSGPLALRPGSRLLVLGASGGVGLFLLQRGTAGTRPGPGAQLPLRTVARLPCQWPGSSGRMNVRS
jgi:hypothetical protein